MKRRKFILTAVAIAAIIIVPIGIYRNRHRFAHDPLVKPDILARFCDEATILKIGRQYRAIVPGENQKEKLTTLILDGKMQTITSDDGISEWIEEKIQKDFEEEKMVIVDGWILSETEARQCALFSLA